MDAVGIGVAANLSGGTVTRAPDQPNYAAGTAVTLTATPDVGWHFTGWTGDTTAAANPLGLVITRNRSLTANFALNTYFVFLSSTGNGSAAKSPERMPRPPE